MNLPPIPAAVLAPLRRALAWAGRNLAYIIAVCLVVFGLSTFRACQEGNKAHLEYKLNPPLPKKAAKKLKAQAKEDSLQAVVYKKIAVRANRQKDSLQVIAQTSTAEADSLHAEINALPAATGGPLSAVQRRLAVFAEPDTAGF